MLSVSDKRPIALADYANFGSLPSQMALRQSAALSMLALEAAISNEKDGDDHDFRLIVCPRRQLRAATRAQIRDDLVGAHCVIMSARARSRTMQRRFNELLTRPHQQRL